MSNYSVHINVTNRSHTVRGTQAFEPWGYDTHRTTNVNYFVDVLIEVLCSALLVQHCLKFSGY